MLKKLKFQYKCPECNKNVTREGPFHSTNKELVVTSAGWCNFRYCEARHKISYKVSQKDNQKPHMKIVEFISNDAEYNKRFHVLEWSGMELDN